MSRATPQSTDSKGETAPPKLESGAMHLQCSEAVIDRQRDPAMVPAKHGGAEIASRCRLACV